MICIVDFGMGNLRSIQHKLYKAGVSAEISSKPIDIETELHSEPYQRADQILNLTTQGHITLEACKELLAGVAVLMKVKEQVEFENRLQALEQANANP